MPTCHTILLGDYLKEYGRVEIMTSDKQAKANRQNALRSTGPKTPEGKAAVRLNALRHGLLSQETLLPGEDEEALRELGERLRDELQPVGELENLLVARIIAAIWRLRRLGRVEAGIFARELYAELAKRARREARSHTEKKLCTMSSGISARPRNNWTKRSTQEAVSEAKEMAAMRDGETATLGQTFIRDAERPTPSQSSLVTRPR